MSSGGFAARLSGSRKVYDKDPIHEALCEFHFNQPSEGWVAMPFKLQDRLRSHYPTDPVRDNQAIQIPFAGGGGPEVIGMPIAIGMPSPGRLRFVGSDSRDLLLVSPGVVGVSAVAPYAGWPALKGRVGETLGAVREIADGNFSISRIGVRYINRVVAPVEAVGEFFELSPLSFGEVNLTTKSFVSRSEMRIGDDEDRVLIAMFATAFDSAGERFLVLDLDVIAQNLEGVETVDAALDLVEELRVFERRAFEAAIKERARMELFGGYREEKSD